MPAQHRQRVETYFDPLPIWYAPFDEADSAGDYGFHALTQRPMAMYHSWGSQNAWLRQIHGENLLHINTATARQLGIADGDWVTVTSAHSSITVMAKLMDGVNANTVWTWNAIGKRAAPGTSPRTSARRRAAFCSIISSAICCRRATDGHRYANADPVTGQAAWYDLRVRIEKAVGKYERSAPAFATLAAPPLPPRPKILRYGAQFRPSANGQ